MEMSILFPVGVKKTKEEKTEFKDYYLVFEVKCSPVREQVQ